MATRNPKWSRDELILTLDFYLRYRPSIPGTGSTQVSELSDFLNRLQLKLGGETGDKFRNPNGVYMKLMNFRRFDPNYEGKGLERGGKDEEVVWNLYSSNPDHLHDLARGIKSLVLSEAPVPPAEIIGEDEEEGEEGQILTRTHRYRERNTKLVARKKQRVLQEKGTLSCEVCGFDFSSAYGERGDGFIECHHTKPVSELRDGETTKINELALVCANCHRMIHRRKPWLSVEELSGLLSD